jgi:hypothetical protein
MKQKAECYADLAYGRYQLYHYGAKTQYHVMDTPDWSRVEAYAKKHGLAIVKIWREL